MNVRDRVAVLSEAMLVCGPGETAGLAGELVEVAARGRRSTRELAFGVVARRFAQIGETDREVVVRLRAGMEGAGWMPLVADLAESMSEEEGASIAMLAGWVGEPALLGYLVRLASHPEDRVASAVEESLERLTGRMGTMEPHAARSVAQAVSAAIGAYGEHRRRGVLRSAALLWGTAAGLHQIEHLGPGGRCAEWWSDATHPASMGLRSLIRRDLDPMVARAALTWLRVDGLKSACRDRLLLAGSAAEHEWVLAGAHLLAHPERRAVLEGMELPASKRRETRVVRGGTGTGAATGVGASCGLGWVVNAGVLARVDESARRFAPEWVRALPMPAEHRRAALGGFVSDPSEVVRHAAVRAATGLRDAETLSDYCYDEGACAAVSAATARMCLRPPAGAGLMSEQSAGEVGAWERLARSTHAGVRRIAGAALERYAGTRAGSAAHVLILRRRARRGREGVLAELKESIATGGESASVSAIRTAVRLGIADAVKVELLRALWRPAPGDGEEGVDGIGVWAGNPERPDGRENRIAATAATALGEVDDETAGEALRMCLGHSDARVRSNALEAIGKRLRRHGVTRSAIRSVESRGEVGARAGGRRGSGLQVMLEFKDDEHHRLRATAGWVILMQGLLREDASAPAWREEAEVLACAMLRDERAGHLLAGLWLSERLIVHASDEARARLGRLAADLLTHPESLIGERAVRCVERSGVWEAPESAPAGGAWLGVGGAGRALTEAA